MRHLCQVFRAAREKFNFFMHLGLQVVVEVIVAALFWSAIETVQVVDKIVFLVQLRPLVI